VDPKKNKPGFVSMQVAIGCMMLMALLNSPFGWFGRIFGGLGGGGKKRMSAQKRRKMKREGNRPETAIVVAKKQKCAKCHGKRFLRCNRHGESIAMCDEHCPLVPCPKCNSGWRRK
jgi:hypothetical protein